MIFELQLRHENKKARVPGDLKPNVIYLLTSRPIVITSLKIRDQQLVRLYFVCSISCRHKPKALEKQCKSHERTQQYQNLAK